MTNHLADEISAIVANMENQESQSNTQPPQDAIQDVYVLIVREHEVAEDQVQVVDSQPPQPQHEPSPSFDYMTLCIVLICCLPILASIFFQVYLFQHPPIATVTIIPTSQTMTLNGTMQLGRVIRPITISQSQTVPTTGKGHQDAKQATGYLTLYNGQFQSVTIAAGTILIGSSGIPIITDQEATIPAANPPSFGYVTVPAHAINAGSRGNIPAYDIHQACCATSVLAKNTQSFSGGQDERTYTTVTHNDIHSISTMLKTTLAHSITGALQGQRKPHEQLLLLPCTPTITSDHQPGDEATSVTVTVSQTCSAVAYNSQELETKATAYLVTQAQHTARAGYSLFGPVNVSVKQARISSTAPHLVFLSFKATGTWMYGLSSTAQAHIKTVIVGKTTQQALSLLGSMPGVEQATIRFTGFGDATRLPTSTGYIHIMLIVV
jgi:hypothetical protein